MKNNYPKFRPFGDSSILIEWPSKIDENILKEVLDYKKSLIEYNAKSILYINHTYNSILIRYVYTIDKINDEISRLKSLFQHKNKTVFEESQLWNIPVCYDQKYGLDLVEISERNQLEISEIIRLHSEVNYLVYFIGFLPGFLYLGGLEKRLHINRKSNPRLQIKKGDVGIGGSQTGIYPSQSPGGWNIIGNCPIDLFDKGSSIPCFAKAGDRIKFIPISLKQHQTIELEVNNGKFDINRIKSETF